MSMQRLPRKSRHVSVTPGAPPMLLNSRIESDEAQRWRLEELTPAQGYAATLAVENDFSRLVLWDLV